MPKYDTIYGEVHAWLTAITQTVIVKAMPESSRILDVNERLALSVRAREASRYLAALADRLELFDA